MYSKIHVKCIYQPGFLKLDLYNFQLEVHNLQLSAVVYMYRDGQKKGMGGVLHGMEFGVKCKCGVYHPIPNNFKLKKSRLIFYTQCKANARAYYCFSICKLIFIYVYRSILGKVASYCCYKMTCINNNSYLNGISFEWIERT